MAPGYNYLDLTPKQFQVTLLKNGEDKTWLLENADVITIFDLPYYPLTIGLLVIAILSAAVVVFCFFAVSAFKERFSKTKVKYADLLLLYLLKNNFYYGATAEQIHQKISSKSGSNLTSLHFLLKKLEIEKYLVRSEKDAYTVTMKGLIFAQDGGYKRLFQSRKNAQRNQKLISIALITCICFMSMASLVWAFEVFFK